MSTRAPSFGRGCRAQRGGVGFLFWRRSGAFVNGVLETISPALFHTARTLSGSLRSPPSPRGEGFVHRYSFLHVSCIRFDDRGIAVFSFRCLPHAGKAVLSLCHHPQPALPLRGQAKEAQEASCASLIGMHFPAEIRCIHCLMSFRIAAEGKTALPEVFLFADIAFDRPAIEKSADIEE